jgi:Family of unknown function (DUF6452)
MKCTLSVLVFFSTFIFIASCKDEYSICNELRDVQFISNIYQKVAGADVLTNAPNFTLVNLNSSLPVYSNQSNLNSFKTELDRTVDTTKFLIKISNSLPQDTITVIYNSAPAAPLGPSCTPVFNFTISKILTTTYTVDSIKIVNPIMNTSLALNAKLYF